MNRNLILCMQLNSVRFSLLSAAWLDDINWVTVVYFESRLPATRLHCQTMDAVHVQYYIDLFRHNAGCEHPAEVEGVSNTRTINEQKYGSSRSFSSAQVPYGICTTPKLKLLPSSIYDITKLIVIYLDLRLELDLQLKISNFL